MAELSLKLVGGVSVMGKYLKRSEMAYMINPKLVVEYQKKVVGVSERVDKTRDPEWNQDLKLQLPATAKPTSKATFKIVHANSYGGEERVVGYAKVTLGDGGDGSVKTLNLLSDDTHEEHGGILNIGWVFKEAPPQEAPAPEPAAPAAPAVPEAGKTAAPAEDVPGADSLDARMKAQAALLREMEQQDQAQHVAALEGLKKKSLDALAETAPAAAPSPEKGSRPAATAPGPASPPKQPASVPAGPSPAQPGHTAQHTATPAPASAPAPGPPAAAVPTPAPQAMPGALAPAETQPSAPAPAHAAAVEDTRQPAAAAPAPAPTPAPAPQGTDPAATSQPATRGPPAQGVPAAAVPGRQSQPAVGAGGRSSPQPSTSPAAAQSAAAIPAAFASMLEPSSNGMDTPAARSPFTSMSSMKDRSQGVMHEVVRPPKKASSRLTCDKDLGTEVHSEPGSPVEGAARRNRVSIADPNDSLRTLSGRDLTKCVTDLTLQKEEAVKQERYLDAQRLKLQLEEAKERLNQQKKQAKDKTLPPNSAQAQRGGEAGTSTPTRQRTPAAKLEVGTKVRIIRRLDLASGVSIDTGAVGDVVRVPGKAAIVQFPEAGVCFAADRPDVVPIAPPVAQKLEGLPSSVAKEAAARQAVADASVEPHFVQGGYVRASRLIDFENGKFVEKNSLGCAVKVPGATAVLRVSGAQFPADQSDFELVEDTPPTPQRSAAVATGIHIPAEDARPHNVPWVEVPAAAVLAPSHRPHTPQQEGEVLSRGPVQHVAQEPALHIPPREAGAYFVRIAGVQGTEVIVSEVRPTDTVLRLKKLLQRYCHTPPATQCLSQELVNGSVCMLDNRRTLDSYDVRPGDVLTLTLPTGLVPITLRLPNGKPARMTGMKHDDTVLTLKRRVHEVANLPISRQCLILTTTGDELHERKTLAASGVSAGCEIIVAENDRLRSTGGRVQALRLSVLDNTGHPDARNYGRTLPLHCCADDTVSTAKRWIAGRMGVPPHSLELLQHGTPVAESQRMREVLQGGTTGLSVAFKPAHAIRSRGLELRGHVSDMRNTVRGLAVQSSALNETASMLQGGRPLDTQPQHQRRGYGAHSRSPAARRTASASFGRSPSPAAMRRELSYRGGGGQPHTPTSARRTASWQAPHRSGSPMQAGQAGMYNPTSLLRDASPLRRHY